MCADLAQQATDRRQYARYDRALVVVNQFSLHEHDLMDEGVALAGAVGAEVLELISGNILKCLKAQETINHVDIKVVTSCVEDLLQEVESLVSNEFNQKLS